MGEEVIGHVIGFAHGFDCAGEIAGVPEDDGGDDQVEAEGTVLLVLERPVTDFTEAVDEDRPRQTVAGFAFVEFLAGLAPKFKVLQPVEGKQRSVQPAEFPERRGNTILAWV